jgi:hypothetical protein
LFGHAYEPAFDTIPGPIRWPAAAAHVPGILAHEIIEASVTRALRGWCCTRCGDYFVIPRGGQ